MSLKFITPTVYLPNIIHPTQVYWITLECQHPFNPDGEDDRSRMTPAMCIIHNVSIIYKLN